MEYEDFLKIVGPLIKKFEIRQNMAECLKIDYDNLKYYNEDILKGAVNYLLQHHRRNDYPLLADFNEAIELCFEKRGEVNPWQKKQIKCLGCLDSGIYYDPIKEKARFCDCEAGIKKRAAWKAYRQSDHDIGEARKAASGADLSQVKFPPPLYEQNGFHIDFTQEIHEKIIQKMKGVFEYVRQKRMKGEKNA